MTMLNTAGEAKLLPWQRRMIYVMSLGEHYRVGKTLLLEQWESPAWSNFMFVDHMLSFVFLFVCA